MVDYIALLSDLLEHKKELIDQVGPWDPISKIVRILHNGTLVSKYDQRFSF